MSGSNSSAPAAAPDGPQPVGLTVHSVPSAMLDLQRQRTRAGRLKMLLVLAACAAPVLASYLSFYVWRPQGAPAAYAQIIHPARDLPAAQARGPSGAAVPLASLKGQWLLVVVAPSACDAACEQLLYTQRQLREMLGRDKDRLDKLWFVPDDGAIRPALAQAVAAQPPVQVLRLDEATLRGWLAPAEGQRWQDHLYVVDPMGRWMMRAPFPLEPARFKRDLDRLLRASASWDRAGRDQP